jgi:amino acid permease
VSSGLWLTVRVVSGIFLINLQIGLGALSMPRTLHTIGLVPGILVIFGVALITTWADMIIGIFKRAHPSVYTMADVGQILFGKPGREIMGFAYWVSHA